MSKRTRARTRLAEATQPLAGETRYTLASRFADRRDAVRDARRGQPPVDAAGKIGAIDTPTTFALRQSLHETSLTEQQQFEHNTRAAFTDLASARRAIVLAETDLARLQERFQDGPEDLDDERAGARRPGEEHLPLAVVQQRRRDEYTVRRNASEAEITRIKQALDGHQMQGARLAAEIEHDHRQLVTRCHRLEAYHLRRFAHYTRHLLRKHAGRHELILQMPRLAPSLPSHLTEPLTAAALLGSPAVAPRPSLAKSTA